MPTPPRGRVLGVPLTIFDSTSPPPLPHALPANRSKRWGRAIGETVRPPEEKGWLARGRRGRSSSEISIVSKPPSLPPLQQLLPCCCCQRTRNISHGISVMREATLWHPACLPLASCARRTHASSSGADEFLSFFLMSSSGAEGFQTQRSVFCFRAFCFRDLRTSSRPGAVTLLSL